MRTRTRCQYIYMWSRGTAPNIHYARILNVESSTAVVLMPRATEAEPKKENGKIVLSNALSAPSYVFGECELPNNSCRPSLTRTHTPIDRTISRRSKVLKWMWTNERRAAQGCDFECEYAASRAHIVQTMRISFFFRQHLDGNSWTSDIGQAYTYINKPHHVEWVAGAYDKTLSNASFGSMCERTSWHRWHNGKYVRITAHMRKTL